jgi:hypothetical protein
MSFGLFVLLVSDFMTIDQLERVIAAARAAGLDGSCEVKFFNPDASCMCGVIGSVGFSQVRKVQQYGVDGSECRSKFLLLSCVSLGGLSFS